MSGTQLLILVLVLIVAGVVGVTLAVSTIQEKDFRDQVSGKKPVHSLDKHQKASYDKPTQEDSQITVDREILRTKGGQNMLGPK